MRACRGLVVAALVMLGSAARAESPADSVVQQLAAQGYVDFSVSRTLLGRVQIIALMPDGGRREIVFNPANGEILRDYYEAAGGGGNPVILDLPADDLPDQAAALDGQPGPAPGASQGNGVGGSNAGGNAGGNSGGSPGNGNAGNGSAGGGNSGGGNSGSGNGNAGGRGDKD